MNEKPRSPVGSNAVDSDGRAARMAELKYLPVTMFPSQVQKSLNCPVGSFAPWKDEP
jgi:hypothetical protein